MKKLITFTLLLHFWIINAQSDTIYYENGIIKKISIIENNREIIKQKEFYKSGKLNRESFSNRFGRNVTRYQRNGELLYIWNYNNKGKRNGKWTGYDENGNVSYINYYKNGIKTGIWKEYYFDENLLSTEHLLYTEEYNEKGNLITRIYYRSNGKPMTIFYYNSEGEKISVEDFNEKGEKIDIHPGIVKSSCN